MYDGWAGLRHGEERNWISIYLSYGYDMVRIVGQRHCQRGDECDDDWTSFLKR